MNEVIERLSNRAYAHAHPVSSDKELFFKAYTEYFAMLLIRQLNTTKKRCDALLHAMINNEDLEKKWWISPNKAFDGSTPEIIYGTDPFKVCDYLMGCAESGC